MLPMSSLQLHGGYGYLNEYPLLSAMYETCVHQILEGTNEIMRFRVSLCKMMH